MQLNPADVSWRLHYNPGFIFTASHNRLSGPFSDSDFALLRDASSQWLSGTVEEESTTGSLFFFFLKVLW